MSGLPTNLSTGTVKGRFITAELLATGDVGPDGVPVSGTVTFTPSAPAILDTGASPSPVTIIPKPVTVSLSGNGEIVNPVDASVGISLLATDDVDGNPTGWTYRATFALAGGLTLAPFSFALPSGATVDLTTVTPVPDSGGTYYLTGPAGKSRPTVLKRSGQWVAPTYASGATDGTIKDNLILHPFYLSTPDHSDFVASGIGLKVNTAGSGDSTVHFGLYGSTAAGLPDLTQLKINSGSQGTAAAANILYTLPANVTLPEGLYWAAFVIHGTTGAVLSSFDARMNTPQIGGGGIDSYGTMFLTGVTGALPTTGTPAEVNNRPPALIVLRAA